MKHFICLSFLLFSFQLSLAQNHLPTKQELDKRYAKINDPNSDEDLKNIEELIESSEKINYKEGIVRGKIKLLYLFHYRSDYKKISTLIIEIEDIGIDDQEQLALLYQYKSYLNKELGIEKEELQNIKEALKYAQQIKDPDNRHFITSVIYSRLALYYDFKLPDSLIYYLEKESEELEQINDNNKDLKIQKHSAIVLNSLNLGNYYLGVHQPQRLDLAEPYYLKVYEYATTKSDVFEMHSMSILCGVGRFYMEKGNYKKSIELANEVLEREKNKKNPAYRMFAYMLLDDSYGGLNNPEEQVRYTKLHAALNDSLNKAAKKEANQEFDRLVTVTKEKKDKEYSSIVKMILISTIAFILLLALFIWFYLKRKNKKFEELITKIKAEKEHNEMLTESQKEIEELEIKSTVTIPEETVKTLLRKLEKFEKSKLYLQQDLSVIWLANHLNTNIKYLSELLKIYRDKNYTNYINGLRINYLLHKLVSDPLYRQYKIEYLAQECGYASRQVFVISFKKETGFTPSYFIENLKSDALKQDVPV